MRTFVYALLLLVCAAVGLAQAPPGGVSASVPITKEPHHHLVLENSYVCVFRVEIISPDVTLLHRHDNPYVYMSIGKAEFTNAVEGKPDTRVKMTDGQLGYSRGGFSHIIRTEGDTPFYNLTIELLHPQGEMRSECAKVVNGPLEGCSAPESAVEKVAEKIISPKEGTDAGSPGSGANTPLAQSAPDNGKRVSAAPPAFSSILESDESTLKSAAFPVNAKTSLSGGPAGILLIVLPLSQFKLEFTDGTSKLLSGGDSLWLAPGPPATITNASEQQASTLLIFGFKDAPKPAAD